MRSKIIAAAAVLSLFPLPGFARQTPASFVQSYDALADAILALRSAEAGFVTAMIDTHRRAAKELMKAGDFEGAAAEMALFANEGDNAVGGIRKRLVEGGHHHNAKGEEQGVYDSGFVIVTREAKQSVLASSAALRQATTDEARQKAWKDFVAVAEKLLARD